MFLINQRKKHVRQAHMIEEKEGEEVCQRFFLTDFQAQAIAEARTHTNNKTAR